MSTEDIQNLKTTIRKTKKEIEYTTGANENIKKYIETQKQLHQRIKNFEFNETGKQCEDLKQTLQKIEKRLRNIEQNQPRTDNMVVPNTNKELQKQLFYANLQEDLKNCLN